MATREGSARYKARFDFTPLRGIRGCRDARTFFSVNLRSNAKGNLAVGRKHFGGKEHKAHLCAHWLYSSFRNEALEIFQTFKTVHP